MKERHKLYLFVGVFIISNILPFFIVVNKVPIYIVWLDNAVLTMYLLSIKKRKYIGIGLILALITETIHTYIIFLKYEHIANLPLSITIAIANIINAYIIFKILYKKGKLSKTTLNEIINMTFLKVLPCITILGIIQQYLYSLYNKVVPDYRFYNFALSNFLGYVFIFTIFYIVINIKLKKFVIKSEFCLFFIIIFAFNTEEVYLRNVFDMNRSHLEYISIFILVLACILLKSEEFIILVVEDFIVSYIMISFFLNQLCQSLREYLVLDLQLFYSVVMTTCFFLIILKTENKSLIREISIKNIRLKKEVDENKEMLKRKNLLIDSIKNIAFIAEEDGNINYANNAFKEIINEKNINESIYFVEALYELRCSKKGRIRREIKIKDKVIMQEMFISKYEDKSFISGVGTEITALKNVQSKLKKSKEEAEEANMAKTSLLARVSHELKTPMNTITGVNYLLSETELTKKQKLYTKKIERASIFLLRMIEDILDVSRINNSKIKLEKNVVRLKKVIENIVLIKEDEIFKKGLEFKVEIDEKIPQHIIGDEFRLQQILINLIGNAIKFTEKGYIKVKLEVIEHSGLEWKIKFIVEDTGIGVCEEKKECIFEPFTQEDESITRKYGGTGIGLTICKNVIEELGGEIILESEKWGGSKFNIILPVKEYAYVEDKKIVSENINNEIEFIKEEEIYDNIDYKQINSLLDKLCGYIQKDVGEAIDKVEEICITLEKTKYKKSLDEIKRLINIFELDTAIDEIKILKAKF